MKVLITGAAGFIGSFVTERLLDDGFEIVGLDNFDPFYPPEVKRANLRKVGKNPRFRLVEGDFRDRALVETVFTEDDLDAVIHLGARAGVRPSLEQAPLYVDVNLDGTINILEACRHHGVSKMLFASSSSVYGERSAPFDKGKRAFSEEDKVDRPISPYAATKKAGELLCYTYCHLFGIDITCLRFFTVYGPRQRPEMAIHAFTRSIDEGKPIEVYGDGSALRDFTYISDIVSGICAALEKCRGYHIYNLGGGDPVELREVIARIEKELDKEAVKHYLPREPGDVSNTYADVSRARQEIGYRSQVSIAEGIRRFVLWYKENS